MASGLPFLDPDRECSTSVNPGGSPRRRHRGTGDGRGRGRVEDGRGSLGPCGQRPVSHPRSSNRTCRFPASGSPTGFTVKHTGRTGRARLLLGTCLSFASRHSILRSLPSLNGVCRLIANHRDLAIFECAPEVRALSSAGATRPQWSYDPVRLPQWPPPSATLRPLPSPPTGLPRLPEPPFGRAVPTTPADQTGARVDCFPACAAFPRRESIMPDV
jgi:hypothetical protein